MTLKYLIATGEHLSLFDRVCIGHDGKLRRATPADGERSFNISPLAKIDNEAGTLEVPLTTDLPENSQ